MDKTSKYFAWLENDKDDWGTQHERLTTRFPNLSDREADLILAEFNRSKRMKGATPWKHEEPPRRK